MKIGIVGKSRYIDVNKLTVCHINVGTVMFPKIEDYVRAKDIENAITADVEEVRHGEWRIVDSDIGYAELECSLCKNKLLFNTDEGFTYCPQCGAKMDGGREENEG